MLLPAILNIGSALRAAVPCGLSLPHSCHSSAAANYFLKVFPCARLHICRCIYGLLILGANTYVTFLHFRHKLDITECEHVTQCEALCVHIQKKEPMLSRDHTPRFKMETEHFGGFAIS